MKVVIASKNPVKISAVEKAFKEVFKEQNIAFVAVSAASLVPDQPMGSEETYQGAWNRAQNAKKQIENATFWVGLEGGLIAHSNTEMEAMAWMVVLDNQDRTGKARTSGFFISPKTIALIKQGYELGHADELLFGIHNSKQKMGSSGLLTKNVINRERFYVDAVILALIPFLNPELFE